jgi:hypothetical protein
MAGWIMPNKLDMSLDSLDTCLQEFRVIQVTHGRLEL